MTKSSKNLLYIKPNFNKTNTFFNNSFSKQLYTILHKPINHKLISINSVELSSLKQIFNEIITLQPRKIQLLLLRSYNKSYISKKERFILFKKLYQRLVKEKKKLYKLGFYITIFKFYNKFLKFKHKLLKRKKYYLRWCSLFKSYFFKHYKNFKKNYKFKKLLNLIKINNLSKKTNIFFKYIIKYNKYLYKQSYNKWKQNLLVNFKFIKPFLIFSIIKKLKNIKKKRLKFISKILFYYNKHKCSTGLNIKNNDIFNKFKSYMLWKKLLYTKKSHYLYIILKKKKLKKYKKKLKKYKKKQNKYAKKQAIKLKKKLLKKKKLINYLKLYASIQKKQYKTKKKRYYTKNERYIHKKIKKSIEKMNIKKKLSKSEYALLYKYKKIIYQHLKYQPFKYTPKKYAYLKHYINYINFNSKDFIYLYLLQYYIKLLQKNKIYNENNY